MAARIAAPTAAPTAAPAMAPVFVCVDGVADAADIEVVPLIATVNVGLSVETDVVLSGASDEFEVILEEGAVIVELLKEGPKSGIVAGL